MLGKGREVGVLRRVLEEFADRVVVVPVPDAAVPRAVENDVEEVVDILGSPALGERVTHAEIVREERKGKSPSDHAPVLSEVN